MKTITVTASVEVPSIPNFLKYEHGDIDVADVDDDGLRDVAKAWADALVANAQKRRANRKKAAKP